MSSTRSGRSPGPSVARAVPPLRWLLSWLQLDPEEDEADAVRTLVQFFVLCAALASLGLLVLARG